jgi:serine/threonine protein kinase
MGELTEPRELVERLAEEFVRRFRAGERPSPEEYARAHPEHAAEIRELFPALVVMEELAPSDGGGSGPPEAEAAASGPGRRERVGDYHILREIGHGGMGVVYEAEQVSLGRRVALKLLSLPAGPGGASLERFRREARAAAQLHHTNIVPVFEVGQDGGTCYYAMQLIHGQGLDEVIKELRDAGGKPGGPGEGPATISAAGPVAQSLLLGRFEAPNLAASPAPEERPGPARETNSTVTRMADTELSAPGTGGRRYYQSVARLGVQAAEALAYAHQRGIIHRDVKPSNLLLDAAGVVWVTDFGLAKHTPLTPPADGADAGEDLTHTGDIIGTIRYMAPERFRGQCDARADVYGLGLTLYELLTLRPAFAGTDRLRLIEQIGRQEPPRPRALDRHIPPDLETVILRAIEKEPGRRYATAGELAADLRRYLADEPVQARRPSALYRLRKFARRNKGLVAAAAAVALTLVVAVAAVSWKWWQAEEARSQEEEAKAQAEGDRDRALRAERQARLREAEALVSQASGIRQSRRPGQRFEALAALGKAAAIGRELGQPPTWFDRPRNEAIAALALPDLHIFREFGAWPPGTVSADLSEDFELYARTTAKGGCTVRRVADDTEVARLPELGEPALVGFGPRRVLARGGFSGLFQVWDVGGRRPRLRLQDRFTHHWSFDPAGRRLAVPHGDGFVSVYDVATGRRLHRLKARENVQYPVVLLHPSGPFLAVMSYSSRAVWVHDLRSGAVVASAEPPWPGGNGGGAWGPDGRTLLVPQADDNTQIREYAFDPAAPALRPLRTLQTRRQGSPMLTFNPAGDRFVSRGWSDTVFLFDATSGQLLFSTPSLPVASYRSLRFDRAGRRLACTRVGDRNERLGLWSVADGREYRYLLPGDPAGNYNGTTVHPGGRLAAVGQSRGVALFDLETGRQVARMPPATASSVAHFDGAGNLLTNGFNGLFRWPVRPDPAGLGRWIIGPPERLPFNKGAVEVAASRDGRVIAQAMHHGYGMGPYAGGWILHPNSAAPRRVEKGASLGEASVSPDGRWVAFVGHGFCAVYDSATGRRVWQPPEPCHALFTPDSRWLLTDADGGRRYAAGTWERGPRLGPGRPWDATREVAVLGLPNGVYRLVELATGRELARLEDQEQNTGYAVLTPDGAGLVVGAANGLRVWDLRRIRTGLAEMGLDWSAPAYPPAKKGLPPLEVSVDPGDLAPAGAAPQVPAQLAEILRGELRPVDAGERAEFARLCQAHGYNAAAARLCEEGFDDLGAPARYLAACAAALAGTGQGEDAPSAEGERARWRGRAVAWLRADLALRQAQLRKEPGRWSGPVRKELGRWQADPRLAAVRDEAALARLPEAEGQGWRRLWADLSATLAQPRATGDRQATEDTMAKPN